MQNFATPAPITAVLNVPSGRVHLVAADRTDTTVQVQPAEPGKGRDAKAAEQTTVDYRDGVLYVQAPEGRQAFGPSGSIEVTVQLPAGSKVEATVASVEFHTSGRLGDVTYKGSYGPVKVGEAASVHLTTDAGDIEIGRLNGPADITVSKGDISVAEAVSGEVVLSTQAGAITVGAAAGVSAALDAGTAYGRVSNSLTNTGTTDLNIHATTAYGDITARSL